jgi:hypothetical protein
MLGGDEITRLNLQKQALMLESGLNRLTLQAEWEKLRSSTAQLSGAGRKRAPLLLVLAPLAGFFLARGARRSKPASWFAHLPTAVKLIGPAIALWKSFATLRKKEDREPGMEKQ